MPVDRVDLVLLEALARTGAIEGAARTAGLAESVARRRLARLENRLGVVLLTSARGRTGLTTAGHVLLSAGRRLLVNLAQAVHQVSGHATLGAEHLRLAAFGRTWDAFADDLAGQLPGVLLDLHHADPDEAVSLFDRRGVDAVYTWLVPGEELTLARPAHAYGVLDEPLLVALPATHRYAAQQRIWLASLAEDDWIVAATERSRRLVRAACAAVGVTARLGPAVRSAASARSLLSHGRGVALASPLVLPPGPDSGVVLRPLVDAPRRRHVLATDPALGEQVRHVLRARLRHAYAVKAEGRNPRYVRSDCFPSFADDPVLPPPPEQPSCVAALPASGPADASLGIELEDLHVLQVVAACGSLNRAAPVLKISQPALSRRIQRLEGRLGAALFVRSYRGTRLGPAAHLLLAAIAEAETAFHRALDAARECADGAA